MIEIYTDGSCRGNGKEHNEGGFGVVVLIPAEQYASGYYMDYGYQAKHIDTTNNRMEMEALIHAIDLATSKYPMEKCTIYCDSIYCVQMCRDWIWK